MALTKKQKRNIAIVGGAAVLTGVGIYLYKSMRPTEPGQPNLPTPPPPPAGATPAPSAPTSFSAPFEGNKKLSVGSRGKEVKYSQRAINDIMEVMGKQTRIATDGVFGNQTKKAFNAVLGKPSGSYNEIKAKKVWLYEQKGLPNPYGESSSASSWLSYIYPYYYS